MFYCVLNREVRAALKRLHEKHTSTKGLSKSTGDVSISSNNSIRHINVACYTDNPEKIEILEMASA